MLDYISEFVQNEAKPSISLSVCQSGWQSSDKGHSYGPAVRDYYVIHYIVSGKGRYYVNNEVYVLQKGSGFLIMPGDSTYYESDWEEPWEYYWFGFLGNEAERLLRLSGLGRDNLIFHYTKDDVVEKHIANIYYASKEYEAREFAMIGYLYLFFSLLIKETATAGGYYQTYLEKAVKYIELHYSQPMTVEDIAAHVGIDRSYLYRIFRAVMDVSVKEYIDSVRLSKARELLHSTALSVSDICSRAGFRESGYFSKKFKMAFGESPAAYRKSLKRG